MTKDLLTALLVNAAVFSVLFLLMLLVRRLLGKRLSPVLMLVLWALVVIKLLIPYGFESDLAVFAPTQTVAAAPADTGIHIPMSVSQDNISAIPQTGTDTGHSASNSANLPEESAYQTTSPISAAAFDWMTLVFGVWAAGALIVMSVYGIGTVNIRRRIRHARLQTPDNIREVLEECRALLGVQRRVSVCVQSAFGMPMMMGAIRPCLVLPESALTLDRKTLRHIMLHELSHLKRGDLLLISGLNLLSAVYWFNPLTWLCFKLIRDDIETACDHSVFAAVGQSSRLDYIDTILYFAGSGKRQRLAAAMALSHRPSTMEKRIMGMFKAARTHAGARCVAMCLAMLMLVVSVFTACQPMEPILANKADGSLAAISRTAEPEVKYEAPARWNETVESKKLRIIFDNDIELPDTNVYPVVKVEPLAFSQQQINKLVKYFAGSEKLFMSHIRTKEEYDDEIAEARRGIVCGQTVDPDSAEEWAQELQKKRDAAPDDSPIIYADTTLTYDRDEFGNDITEKGKNYLSVCFVKDDGSQGAIYANNYLDGRHWQSTYFGFFKFGINYMNESMYQNVIVESGETEEETGWTGVSELFDTFSADKEAALEKANQVLGDLDIDDMMLASYEKVVAPDAPEKSGYMFVFARQNGSAPVYEFGGGSFHKDEDLPAYASPTGEETIRLWVSKDGVEGFGWNGQSRVVETVTQNAKLLPFEDIQKAVRDSISYRKSFYTRGYVSEKAEVKVTSVKLKAAYIGMKDNPTQALIVPAWVIESTFSYDNGGDTQTIYDDACVVNAIDGGEIGLPMS